MTNYYISSVAYTSVAQWAAGHTYAVGNYVRQLAAPAFGNERVFKATSITTGVSGGSEPSWTLTNNGTTTDSGVTWTQVAGQEAQQSAGNWKAPLANIQAWFNLFSTSNATLFLSNDHAESSTSALAYNVPTAGIVLSVSRTGASIPPTSADIATGAAITATVNQSITWTSTFTKGVTFNSGSSTGTGATVLRPRGNTMIMEDCTIGAMGSGGGNIQIGAGDLGGMKLRNCSLKFGGTSSQLLINGFGSLEWDNSTIVAGTNFPSVLFASGTGDNMPFRFRGCDFTGLTSVITTNSPTSVGPGIFEDCIFVSDLTQSFAPTLTGGTDFKFVNCSSGSSTTKAAYITASGLILSRADTCRVNGAADATANFGWAFRKDGNGTNSIYQPFYGPRLVQPVTTTGGSKTVTLYLCATTTLDNSQAWIEVETLEASGTTLGSLHTTRATPLTSSPTTLTTDTSDWTQGASARQNTHAYSVGDAIKLASNTGRLFICTSAGTSAGSEPGAYASATDGTSVTDSGATFVAVNRYIITQAYTPGKKGMCRVRPVLATTGTQASTYVIIDPLFTVT
jgi:hypothetical protein